MIGFAVSGSFCSFEKTLNVLQMLKDKGEDILPIFSFNASTLDTRFAVAKEYREKVEEICGHKAILTIPDAEPLGPSKPLELLVICPCTGNTMAKLSNGITDTPVTMAAKAHLRCARPLVIALASNDAMAANFQNLAHLYGRKNIYFVPLSQDDPQKKPFSLVCDFSKVADTVERARKGTQSRPLILS